MAMGMSMKSKFAVATKIVAADGTGDFDDIQTAINELPTGGGVVYIKEGTYTLTTDVDINKNNVAIIGAGYATLIKFSGTGITNGLFKATTQSNLHLESMRFDVNNSFGEADLPGIYFSSVTDSFIHNIWVTNATSYAISLYTSSRITTEFCNISNLIEGANYGIYLNNCEHCIIQSNIFKEGENTINLYETTDSIIIGNVIYSTESTRGIELTSNSSHNLIVGNRIETYTGIYLSSSSNYNNVSFNSLVDCTTSISDNGTGNSVNHNTT